MAILTNYQDINDVINCLTRLPRNQFFHRSSLKDAFQNQFVNEIMYTITEKLHCYRIALINSHVDEALYHALKEREYNFSYQDQVVNLHEFQMAFTNQNYLKKYTSTYFQLDRIQNGDQTPLTNQKLINSLISYRNYLKEAE